VPADLKAIAEAVYTQLNETANSQLRRLQALPNAGLDALFAAITEVRMVYARRKDACLTPFMCQPPPVAFIASPQQWLYLSYARWSMFCTMCFAHVNTQW
jgi:hypothetical protein